MSADYKPKSVANLKSWLAGLKIGIINDGPSLGRTAAQVTADTAFIDTMLTPVTAAHDMSNQAIEAEGLARQTLQANNAPLRDLVNNYKSSPGWNTGMAISWKVNTHTTQYDMDTHQPKITVENIGGQTVVRGQKPGFTSVTIQMRLAGTSAWLDIGIKLSRFPFFDTTPAQTPGKPENREYRALGFVGDQQMGQPSDIVPGIFNG